MQVNFLNIYFGLKNFLFFILFIFLLNFCGENDFLSTIRFLIAIKLLIFIFIYKIIYNFINYLLNNLLSNLIIKKNNKLNPNLLFNKDIIFYLYFVLYIFKIQNYFYVLLYKFEIEFYYFAREINYSLFKFSYLRKFIFFLFIYFFFLPLKLLLKFYYLWKNYILVNNLFIILFMRFWGIFFLLIFINNFFDFFIFYFIYFFLLFFLFYLIFCIIFFFINFNFFTYSYMSNLFWLNSFFNFDKFLEFNSFFFLLNFIKLENSIFGNILKNLLILCKENNINISYYIKINDFICFPFINEKDNLSMISKINNFILNNIDNVTFLFYEIKNKTIFIFLSFYNYNILSLYRIISEVYILFFFKKNYLNINEITIITEIKLKYEGILLYFLLKIWDIEETFGLDKNLITIEKSKILDSYFICNSGSYHVYKHIYVDIKDFWDDNEFYLDLMTEFYNLIFLYDSELKQIYFNILRKVQEIELNNYEIDDVKKVFLNYKIMDFIYEQRNKWENDVNRKNIFIKD
jgi:hypothetical protein